MALRMVMRSIRVLSMMAIVSIVALPIVRTFIDCSQSAVPLLALDVSTD